jgi:hypothetical protein
VAWLVPSRAAISLWVSPEKKDNTTTLRSVAGSMRTLDSLRITLGGLGHCRMWAGDFAGADVAHSEATRIGVALGEDASTWEALKVELLAWQGRDADTQFVASLLTGKLTETVGGGVGVNLAGVSLVILDLARGRYDDALATALEVMADDPCPHGSQVRPELVEAATRSGDAGSAHAALDRLRQRAEASGTPWALGLLARSEALAGDGDAEAHHRRALDLLGTHVKTDLARAHLLYGEWLRREKRRADAREQLRAAFERSTPWARRRSPSGPGSPCGLGPTLRCAPGRIAGTKPLSRGLPRRRTRRCTRWPASGRGARVQRWR